MAINSGHDDHDRRAAAAAEGRIRRWLPWILGAIALLILILALRSCGDDDRSDNITTTGDPAVVDPAATSTLGTPVAGEASAWNSQAFTTYLGGNEPVGRAFALDRVTFASGSSLIKERGAEPDW